MRNRDIFSMSLRNLFKRKLRTFLTILGVVIGTASIVSMISLGLAMNKTFETELEKMGDITTVTVYNPGGGGDRYMVMSAAGVTSSGSGAQEALKLDDNAIVTFSQLPGVIAATPLAQGYLNFKSGKYGMSYTQVRGIDPAAMEVLGYKTQTGRLLEEGDKYNLVFGANVELFFYNTKDRNAWGWERYYKYTSGEEVETLVDVQTDRIQMSYDYRLLYPENIDDETASQTEGYRPPPKPINITVVGVLEEKDYATDQAIFMDINQLLKLKAEQQKYEQSNRESYGYYSTNVNTQNGYDTALVKCKDLDTVKEVKQMITDMGYPAEIPSQYLDSMQQMAASLQGLLGAIGAVSLFVAAIGIANTMIMAIYERTREIGVMKVIGARLSDIRKLFLLEAALIGFFGGVFGVLLSLGVSYLLNSTEIFSFLNSFNASYGQEQGQISLITPWLCVTALAFASFIGLVSGYFPARRAMRLSALSAIRTE